MNMARDEAYKLATDYKQVIREFLGGGVDELFSFLQSNSQMVSNHYISAGAKEVLRRALSQQHADAVAYQEIVRLAREAGVPLFYPPKKEPE